MTCDSCGKGIEYCFYINDEHWLEAVGKTEGHVCAHCVLQKIGGSGWQIIWNEAGEKSMGRSGQWVEPNLTTDEFV